MFHEYFRKQGKLTFWDGLALLFRWGIAGVFVAAAIPKILNPDFFAATIGAYGLLPDALVKSASWILPPLEIILAVGLVRKKLWGWFGIAGMLVVFILILGYGIHLGLDIDCGCFGPEDPEHDAFSGLRTALVRDVVMLALLGFSYWYSTGSKRFNGSLTLRDERRNV